MTTTERIKSARAVMKKCQRGCHRIDESNNLHAECFGTIGGLIYELTLLMPKERQVYWRKEVTLWKGKHLIVCHENNALRRKLHKQDVKEAL